MFMQFKNKKKSKDREMRMHVLQRSKKRIEKEQKKNLEKKKKNIREKYRMLLRTQNTTMKSGYIF